MLRTTARTLCGMAILIIATALTQAQSAADCANLMKFGIYDKFRTFNTESHYKQIREFFENNSFRTRQEAQAKATELGLEIEDVLNLNFGETSSTNNFEQWKQRLIQSSYQEVANFALSATTIERISNRITGVVEQCIRQKGVHAYVIPTADNQTFVVTVDYVPFTGDRPRTTGRIDMRPASVASLCSPSGIIGVGDVEIGPEGKSVSCRRLPTDTVVVTTNTRDGSPSFTYDAHVVPVVSMQFNASPSDPIDAGQEAVLTWDVRNALSVSLDGSSVQPNDRRVITPSRTTEYRLTATSLDGKIQPPKAVTVRVNPPPPTLSGARVFFHIRDDDKDRNTNIVVNVECPTGGVIATIAGTFDNRWPDNTDNGPFDMSVLVGQPKNRISGCQARFSERPVGNDDIHFDWWLELRFSDGSTLRRSGSANTSRNSPSASLDF